MAKSKKYRKNQPSLKCWAAASLVTFAVLACSPAGAVDLDAKAAPGVTWFDLMKLVVPDLARGDNGEGAVGHKVIPFTHIEGKDAIGAPPDDITLSSIDVRWIPGDPTRVLVLADLGPSEGYVADYSALALFSLSPKPRLIDVVGVGADRWVGFHEAAPVMLGPHSPLILVYSEHNDADVGFDSMAMIYLRRDRLRFIDRVRTFGIRTCGYDRTQEPAFTTVPDKGPYRAAHVRIVETVKLTGEDGCGDKEKPPKAGVRIYEGTYRWDPARERFSATPAGLRRLKAVNDKAF